MKIYHFYRFCSAFHFKNTILFYDRHSIHFDDSAILRVKYIHLFVLKAIDYENEKPSDNVTNSKLQSLYNNSKDNWHQQFGTMNFTLAHTENVLIAD